MVVLLIDGGYFICFRLFATLQWWALAHKDENPEDSLIPFRNAFKDRFIKSLPEFLKKINANPSHIVFAMDQKIKDLWRTKIYSDYKKGRTSLSKYPRLSQACLDKGLIASLCSEMGISVVSHPHLEADDCIFVLSKLINKENTIIVTNDNDYLQILPVYGSLINLKGQNLRDRSMGDPTIDLQVKILSGDKSDNIPPVFKGCGPKTAIKITSDPDFLKNKEEKLSEEDRVKLRRQIELNTRLIDFNQIPNNYILEFMDANQRIISSVSAHQ